MWMATTNPKARPPNFPGSEAWYELSSNYRAQGVLQFIVIELENRGKEIGQCA